MAPLQKCQASNRNYESCLLSGSSSVTQFDLENQYLCGAHREEYRRCYMGYKDHQRKLEEQKFPECPSVGGTGRVKAMPLSKADISACKQSNVLQRLQQYYRERNSLLKLNIDTRKLVMKRFHPQDKDWGHMKAIQDLQVERTRVKDLLECVEEQLHNLSLPARKRDKLRKWASAVKKQVHELKLKKSTASTQDATRADTKPPTSVRPMEHLKVQIASPEEEPDPLAAELAARRQELLGDFWFFLKYRFELQFEPSNDFLQLAACIFRRIVLATPGALVLTKAHSSIRNFLEDESINIDILQDLWDLMQESPPSLIWAAIADYRTFFNTQFEEKVHEVPENKKLFILGGYVHLEDSESLASSSPEVSWSYLMFFANSWYLPQQYQVLARTFREALILKQLMYLVDVPRWGFFWNLLESVIMSEDMRLAEKVCTFSDIIIMSTSGRPSITCRVVPPPPGYQVDSQVQLLNVETEIRPQVFFQIGIDDPYALPLIEEFKQSPQYHAVWVKNAKTGQVVCTPRSQQLQLWTKRIRWTSILEWVQCGDSRNNEFVEVQTLAQYLSELEAGKWETVGLEAIRQSPAHEPISGTYKDYYLVLIMSIKPGHILELLLSDLWLNAGIVRDQQMSEGTIWKGNDHTMIELLNSHPFFREFYVENKLQESDKVVVPRKSPSTRRATRWPKEAYRFLDEITKLGQSVMSEFPNANPLPTPEFAFNDEQYMIDCRILARRYETQGILEIADTSADIDFTKLPLGFGFHIPHKSGLYVEFPVSNHPQSPPRFTCATLRPSKLVLGPDDTIVRLATKYKQDHRNASFTLFFLRSEAFHWPFKFEQPLPYWFHIAPDTRVYTTRYLIKDAPGSDAAVHGYMNHCLVGLEDCVVWRDVIMCMKPNSKVKMRLGADYPQRIQGSADLVKDMERFAKRSIEIWENVFCKFNIPLARAYAPRKVTATLKFEVLGAKNVAAVRDAMNTFLAREYD